MLIFKAQMMILIMGSTAIRGIFMTSKNMDKFMGSAVQ